MEIKERKYIHLYLTLVTLGPLFCVTLRHLLPMPTLYEEYEVADAIGIRDGGIWMAGMAMTTPKFEGCINFCSLLGLYPKVLNTYQILANP